MPVGLDDYFRYPIPPKVVAIATAVSQPRTTFPDSANLPGVIQPRYGQDTQHSYRRAAPEKEDVGATPDILKPKMRELLRIFAAGDRSGMATRLFDAFLQAPSRQITYFDDPALDAAVAMHPNTRFFCDAALSAPNLSNQAKPGAIRIHQALKNAGWDITKIQPPTDLGPPAFNMGSRARQTEDFNNGLGLMMDGVQHAYVVATHYGYDQALNQYCIGLKYIFYDVFGLDDKDLRDHGTASGYARVAFTGRNAVQLLAPLQLLLTPSLDVAALACIGITAWWQLQHQHNYVPLITRAIVRKVYVAPAQ